MPDGARGVSIGKTLPAIPQEPQTVYLRLPLTAENAAAIPCRQVLGVYSVSFPGRTDREAPLTPCKSPENRVY